MSRIRLTKGPALFFLNHRNSPKCIPYDSSFFGTPPRDIRLFRALHRLSICCVWAPLLGSTKCWLWFTVSWL